MSRRSLEIMVAIACVLAPSIAAAQAPPADLTLLPPVSQSYVPARTAWGDPDFRGTFPLENIDLSRIRLTRPKEFGNRVWVTDAEFATRLETARKSDAAYSTELGGRGTKGLAPWMEKSSFAHRTSMIVSPANGQLPALTPYAEVAQKAGRTSWRPGQKYDAIADFDTFDRCVSRGMPGSMLPFRYNNGIRIFQSPGYVVLMLEMLGTRIVPIGKGSHPPKGMESWLGDSRGHWEGNTLVIETANIKSGDNASDDLSKRAASPLNQATQGAPAFNSLPTGKAARAVERLTMTDANTIAYELTYSDPEVFTAPWTVRVDWPRNDAYEMFEYACHEGNTQLRGRITAWRAQHAQEEAGKAVAARP
ncbi:MAG: hypothetical protein J7494_00640 [Sphingobium sp.]|nr:hypothetical protein [Sphingobium sp.]